MGSLRTYRPSCFLRIFIRLEDFTKDDDPNVPTETKPAPHGAGYFDKKLQTAAQERDELTADQAHEGGTNAAQLQRINKTIRQLKAAKQRSQAAPKAAAQTAAPGDAYSIVIYTVPIDASCELNGFRLADTLSVTFPFVDAPFYSYMIRSALLEYWAGTKTAEDFAKPDKWALNPKEKNTVLLFRGYADQWDSSHSEADATVSVTARSFESVLIDGKINPLASAYRIKGQKEKISVYANRILSQFPPTSGNIAGDQFRAVWFAADASKEPEIGQAMLSRSLQTAQSRNKQLSGGLNPTAAPPAADNYSDGNLDPGQSQGGAQGDARMPMQAPSSQMSVWDLLTQACELAGCFPVYDPSLPPYTQKDASGQDVVISPINSLLLRPAQTIYEDVANDLTVSGGPVDGFSRPITFADGRAINSQVRFMVWGHNVKEMKTSRKLGRQKILGVEVVSYNHDAEPGKRTIAVRFPDTKIVTRKGAKGEGDHNEILTRVVQGVRDPAVLKQIAVNLYHAISRQEMTVSIETDDLASYIDPTSDVDHNSDPDLLHLRPGSPCRVTVARELRQPSGDTALSISPLSSIFELRGPELVNYLKSQRQKFDPQRFGYLTGGQASDLDAMSKAMSKAMEAVKFLDLFYCRSMTHKFNADTGWSASIELVNYLVARADPKNLGGHDAIDNDALKTTKRAPAPADISRAADAAAVARAEPIINKMGMT